MTNVSKLVYVNQWRDAFFNITKVVQEGVRWTIYWEIQFTLEDDVNKRVRGVVYQHVINKLNHD